MAQEFSLSLRSLQLLLSSVLPGSHFPHLGHERRYPECLPLAAVTASQHVSKVIDNPSK